MREHLVRAPYMAISRGLHSHECARCTRGKEASSSRPLDAEGDFPAPALPHRSRFAWRTIRSRDADKRRMRLSRMFFIFSSTFSIGFSSAITYWLNYDLQRFFFCRSWHCYNWRRCEKNSNDALYCYNHIIFASIVNRSILLAKLKRKDLSVLFYRKKLNVFILLPSNNIFSHIVYIII